MEILDLESLLMLDRFFTLNHHPAHSVMLIEYVKCLHVLSCTLSLAHTYTHTFTLFLSPTHAHTHIHTHPRYHTHSGVCGVVHLNRPLRVRKHDEARHYERRKKDDIMYGHTTRPMHDTRHFHMWLKFHRLETPVCDRAFAPKEDRGVVRYPSDSSAFVPFVEEESLKGYVRMYIAVQCPKTSQEDVIFLPSFVFCFVFYSFSTSSFIVYFLFLFSFPAFFCSFPFWFVPLFQN